MEMPQKKLVDILKKKESFSFFQNSFCTRKKKKYEKNENIVSFFKESMKKRAEGNLSSFQNFLFLEKREIYFICSI